MLFPVILFTSLDFFPYELDYHHYVINRLG